MYRCFAVTVCCSCQFCPRKTSHILSILHFTHVSIMPCQCFFHFKCQLNFFKVSVLSFFLNLSVLFPLCRPMFPQASNLHFPLPYLLGAFSALTFFPLTLCLSVPVVMYGHGSLLCHNQSVRRSVAGVRRRRAVGAIQRVGTRQPGVCLS